MEFPTEGTLLLLRLISDVSTHTYTYIVRYIIQLAKEPRIQGYFQYFSGNKHVQKYSYKNSNLKLNIIQKRT